MPDSPDTSPPSDRDADAPGDGRAGGSVPERARTPADRREAPGTGQEARPDAAPSTTAASDPPNAGSNESNASSSTERTPVRTDASGVSASPDRGFGPPPFPQRAPSSSGSFLTVDRVVRFVLGVGAAAAVAWLLWYFAALVVYLAVGGILAYVLRPIVDRFQGIGLGRVPAILTTFLVVFTTVGILVTSIVPFVAEQVRDLSQLISTEVAIDVARYIEDRLRGVVPIDEGTLVANVRQVAEALMQGDLVEGDRVASTVSSVVSVFTNIVYAVIIIPFITFFLLKDGVQLRRSVLQVVPNRYFEITLAILDKVEINIGRYFRALLIQSTSIAIIASTLLWIVGLQNSIAVGIFTGLANTIPYFGPFLGFIGGALIGIAQTGTLGLVPGVALAMALTQLADNILLQPIIFSRAAQAHPLVILFVVLIGAQLAGIVGMLIAIPLATTVRVVVEQVLWSLRNYRILRSS